MKKIFITTFILTIFISACGSSISTTAPGASESTSTVTQVPPTITATTTATEIPTLPPTITPIPTLSLPVSQLTPVPSSNTKISAENVQGLQEIAKYYGEINYIARLTKDNKSLFILDPDGLTKYDYASMEILTHVFVTNSVSDLQINNDSNLLMIDKKWLLDLKNDKEPILHVLSDKIHLLNRYSRDFALSPDGKVIAVAQHDCKDLCKHFFRLVNTEDFSDLFTTSAQHLRQLPTFSSDGTYFALADKTQAATSGGGTEVTGGFVGIWTTSDFTKVSSFSVNFPFDVTGIAFSEDDTRIAIAQTNSIDIYDMQSGDPVVAIADLCDSGQRKVMFAPSTTDKFLEHSDCSSGVWTISGSTARLSNDDVPNLSRISFDEKGNFKAIPYIYPTTSSLRAYRDQYYLKFLNNDTIGFKNFDLVTLDRHSCDLSLASGSLECQSHAPENNNGRYLGNDVILATDGKYYRYVVGKSKVDIYSFEDPSQVYYSIPFRDYLFDLVALDPINNLVFYNVFFTPDYSKSIIQDINNDKVLEQWEGTARLSLIAISENNKIAGICINVGNTNAPNIDRLVLFDLLEKRTVYSADSTCGTLNISSDGSRLALVHNYLKPTDQYFSLRTLLLDTTTPYEKKYLNFDSWFYPNAAAFSPDGSMLVVGCSDNEICFFDLSDNSEIYRLKAHSGIASLAFSPDGSLLATSSNWGLISLWAVPPFTSGSRSPQSSPLSSYIPSFVWNFDEDGWFEGWGEQDWQSGDLNNLKVKNGYLSASTTGNDPQISSNEGLGIDAAKFSQIEIRMSISAGDSAQLFFRNENNDMSENKSIIFPIEAGTEFKTYLLDMSTISSWKNMIHQLRLDPTSDVFGATIEIDYIRLLP